MLDDILAIPDHIRDAIWRVDSARLVARPSAGFTVCGMGGSAIGGELAERILGELAWPVGRSWSGATGYCPALGQF